MKSRFTYFKALNDKLVAYNSKQYCYGYINSLFENNLISLDDCIFLNDYVNDFRH